MNKKARVLLPYIVAVLVIYGIYWGFLLLYDVVEISNGDYDRIFQQCLEYERTKDGGATLYVKGLLSDNTITMNEYDKFKRYLYKRERYYLIQDFYKNSHTALKRNE